MNIRYHKRMAKVCALAAAALILPGLAFADDNSQGNGDQGNTQHVPDGGPGIVLLTTALGSVLLFGAIQRSRAKA